MSGGDLLFIFSFLILPTVILVSCIWLWILLRKGVLLPPARHEWVDADVDADAVAEQRAAPMDGEQVVATPPGIAVHSTQVIVDDAESLDAADASQQTMEFDTWSADDIDASEADVIAGADATPAIADGDTGTEALPVQQSHPHVHPVEAHDAVIDEHLAVATVPELTSVTEPSIDDFADASDAQPRLPATAELAQPATHVSNLTFDDEVFAPLEPIQNAATVEETPEVVADAGDDAGDESVIEITDEHPIIELSPAAMSANGLDAAATAVDDERRAVPRRHVRRPAERARPTLFRKGRG